MDVTHGGIAGTQGLSARRTLKVKVSDVRSSRSARTGGFAYSIGETAIGNLDKGASDKFTLRVPTCRSGVIQRSWSSPEHHRLYWAVKAPKGSEIGPKLEMRDSAETSS